MISPFTFSILYLSTPYIYMRINIRAQGSAWDQIMLQFQTKTCAQSFHGILTDKSCLSCSNFKAANRIEIVVYYYLAGAFVSLECSVCYNNVV